MIKAEKTYSSDHFQTEIVEKLKLKKLNTCLRSQHLRKESSLRIVKTVRPNFA